MDPVRDGSGSGEPTLLPRLAPGRAAGPAEVPPVSGVSPVSGVPAADGVRGPDRNPGRTRGRQTVLVLVVLVAVMLTGLAVAAAVVPGDLARPASAPSAAANVLPAGPAASASASTPGYRPGIDAPGTDVLITVGPGSETQVEERVVLARPAAAGLPLAPADLTDVPAIRFSTPMVTEVTATQDGAALPVQRTGAGWVVQPGTGRSLSHAVITYRTTGAVIRDESTRSRALLLATPLTAAASLADGSPVLIRVAQATVREAACVTAPAAEQLCGAAGSDGWVARLTASSTVPVVVFQVDVDG